MTRSDEIQFPVDKLFVHLCIRIRTLYPLDEAGGVGGVISDNQNVHKFKYIILRSRIS